MKRLVVLFVLFALVAAVAAQVPAQPPGPPPVALPPQAVDVFPPPAAPIQNWGQPAPAHHDGIDALIARLAAIKKQQADLAKAEKDTVARLKEKVRQQKEQLKKLGVEVEDATPPRSEDKKADPLVGRSSR
jgi:hypothetical protein